MFVSKKVLENEETMKSIAAMKPSEKLIDDASLLDVELF